MTDKQQIISTIRNGRAVLGIELGSTRIKAVLIDENHRPIASASHEWQNSLEDGIWTYHLDLVWQGLQDAYSKLVSNIEREYGVLLTRLSAMGVSAMMHGYLVFDKNNRQLVPFRTWRNTMTEEAAKKLTELFGFHIPQRWSISHLYQAILNGENHVPDIRFMTTLSSYIHWKLTGEKVIGVGDASGMFPVDSIKNNYDSEMLHQFEMRIQPQGYAWTLDGILPQVLSAGEPAGRLTAEGARLLDPSGKLEAGVPLCPPEGDAGTGMVATNSVAVHTGNISAGTSVFVMVVLKNKLSRVYPEIDMVVTPIGRPVAMVHCNNCTSDLDAWVGLFREFSALTGAEISTSDLYDALYAQALHGAADCDGILSYNFFSGEPLAGLAEGRPLLIRMPDSRLSLANFMRAQLFACMGALRLGMDILVQKENVKLDCLIGHGGFFKTKVVGQRLMAAAMNVPVTVKETAGEGGAWGIALLGAYMKHKAENETLEQYLDTRVFANDPGFKMAPDKDDREVFDKYMKRYTAGLAVEMKAVEVLR